MPRGRALGVTMYLPEEDSYSYSKRKLESQLSSLYGGRLAEEIIYGEDAVTTGASNDIERATAIARNMVTKWGLSDNLGPLLYEEEDKGGFMGTSRNANVSGEVSKKIDEEIRNIIDRNYERARQILTDNNDKLEIMTECLMKYETIDKDQVDRIMAGKEPGAPKDWVEPDDNIPPQEPKVSLEDASEKVADKSGDDMVKKDLDNDSVKDSGEPKLH
jgi:cell division protease FtsH